MSNTMSAKKALRQSKRKKSHNMHWKRRIRDVTKSISKHLEDKTVNIDIIKKEQALLYKTVDKASKENVIHRNKARRIKSKISKQITAHEKNKGSTKEASKEKKPTKAAKKSKSKSKSAKGK